MTTQRRGRRWLTGLVVLSLVAAAVPFLPKQVIEFAAAREARRIVARLDVGDGSEQDLVLAATRRVYTAYLSTQRDESRPGLLMALRPYLSNALLPGAIRVAPGAIEILALDGYCDSAARTLAFLLRQEGFDAGQLNIIAPNGGHSVVEARSATRSYMLDPHLGIVPMRDGRVLSPAEAHRAADDPGIWQSLLQSRDSAAFYDHFADASYARQGAGLVWRAVVTLAPGAGLVLGRIDGSAQDVEADGRTHLMSPYWGYIGSRYDRSWRRELRFPQETIVEFTLTGDLNPRFLNLDPAPEIDGRTLTVRLPAGGILRLDDGAARRDFRLFRSYQEVDRVRFMAAGEGR